MKRGSICASPISTPSAPFPPCQNTGKRVWRDEGKGQGGSMGLEERGSEGNGMARTGGEGGKAAGKGRLIDVLESL